MHRVRVDATSQGLFTDSLDALPGSIDLPKSSLGHEDILLKYNRIYHHKLMRINYTTYDVRRAQDTINIGTMRRDIMVLHDSSPEHLISCPEHVITHPYLYARVLGIFHVNAIYTGGTTPDYNPTRFDLLWVRWFHTISPGSWQTQKLETIAFPPMASEGAFGFLDPNDVVRSCHIIPDFASGKRYSDGQGLSLCSRDEDDYYQYYVGR